MSLTNNFANNNQFSTQNLINIETEEIDSNYALARKCRISLMVSSFNSIYIKQMQARSLFELQTGLIGFGSKFGLNNAFSNPGVLWGC